MARPTQPALQQLARHRDDRYRATEAEIVAAPAMPDWNIQQRGL